MHEFSSCDNAVTLSLGFGEGGRRRQAGETRSSRSSLGYTENFAMRIPAPSQPSCSAKRRSWPSGHARTAAGIVAVLLQRGDLRLHTRVTDGGCYESPASVVNQIDVVRVANGEGCS